MRQAQLELTPFDAERLRSVALRLRELFPTNDRRRLDTKISTTFIERLVAEVTAGFKRRRGCGSQTVSPAFVTQMDLVEEHEDYDPIRNTACQPNELNPEEQHVLTGAPLGAGDDDNGPVPVEDAW